VCCLTHKVVKARCRAVNCGCPMEGNPLEVPFEHGLAQFARSLPDGQSKAVAIGSSTTAGEGDIVPYQGVYYNFCKATVPLPSSQ